MDKKYARALRRFPPFAKAAETLCKRYTGTHAQVTAQVTAPVLFAYVWHVLVQAERMGLKRLYFLARDSYLMLETARQIAKVCPVSLELRYLYCSRRALRLSCCHRMDAEEAIALLLRKGGLCTVQRLMDRAVLTPEEQQQICEELSIQPQERNKQLTDKEYADTCDVLRRSVLFRKAAIAHSREAYETLHGYLLQEGLADGTSFGIVDTGWTSSIQRNLRLLLDDIPPVTGFYFGMTEPQRAADGVCSTWLFGQKDAAVQARFHRSLFTCMCAAPNAASSGYRVENGRYVPVIQEERTHRDALRTQLALCREFAELCAPEIHYGAIAEEKMRRLSLTLLNGLMYAPTAEEVRVFEDFPCHDGAISLHPEQKSAYFWDYGALTVAKEPAKALRRRLRYWQKAGTLAWEQFRNA